MELEIRGFIEFCKALSKHPDLIIKTPSLPDVIIFCHSSISNCNCGNKELSKRAEFEKTFHEKMIKLPPEVLKEIGTAFDPENTYEIINVSFPENEGLIKLK